MPIVVGPRRLALEPRNLRADIDGDQSALRQKILVVRMPGVMLFLIGLPRTVGVFSLLRH